MKPAKKTQREEFRTTSTTWIGIAALVGMLAVFAGIVTWVTLSLREDVRGQLIARDSHVLGILLQNSIERAEAENLIFDFEVLSEDELWRVLLDSSTAEGVFAAQLFSPTGVLKQSTSETLVLERLPESVLEVVRGNRAYPDFKREVPLSELVNLDYREDRIVTILNLYLPLHSEGGELLGIGRFLLDGSLLLEEFSILDARLTRQASVAVGLGSLLIFCLSWMAWWKLNGAKRELQAQAERLRRANSELAMLARTSAVGSVAAHLIHGLKNPLAGLRQVVRSGGEGGALQADDWEGAQDAANRMQTMVEEVVGILQDAGSDEADYELSLSEIAAEVSKKFTKTARPNGGSVFDVETMGGGLLDSHRANIVILIVANLAQNAIDAVSGQEFGKVHATFACDGESLHVSVQDNGPGLDDGFRGKLFEPIPSPKEGGAGIGLAISHQMARHVGGVLECLRSEKGKGCTFELRVPLSNPEALTV